MSFRLRSAVLPDPPPGKVIAWRNYWLAPSETFIRDQVSELTRWEPVCIGRREYNNPLVVPHFAPHSDSIVDRIAGRLPPSPRNRSLYDQLLADPDVKIIHAHFGTDGVTAMPYAERAAKPLVVSFYGMDVTSMPFRRSLAAQRYRAMLPELFDSAHTLVTVSQFLSDRLIDLGAPPSKIRLNYPGTTVHARMDPRAERKGVIFVGRLVEKKGVRDLLEAMALLPQPLRSIPITIVGYGPLLHDLQRIAADRQLNVDFVGRMSSSGISQLLREHAVFCGPSQSARNGDAEGLGMVFIEAALAGLPVVSSRHGGVPESVDHRRTGLLAPEGDVQSLSHHLGQLLADPPGAAAMGRAGYRSAARSFELRARTADLERLYDDVVNSGVVRPDSAAGALPLRSRRTFPAEQLIRPA